jgi:hypothetical protein
VRTNAVANGVTSALMPAVASVDAVGSLTVRAIATVIADADSDASSLALLASVRESRATASSAPNVAASLGTAGIMNVNGNVTIIALANGSSSSDAEGDGAALGNLGISAASSTWNPTVTTSVTSGGINAGGSIYVRAHENCSESTGAAITANRVYARASSAGLGVGVASAASATANSTATVTTTVAAGVHLTSSAITGIVDIVALSRGYVYTIASGQAYGAATEGTTNSSATRRNTTLAGVADGSSATGAQLSGYNVRILASSNDAGYAAATAGSGGLYSDATAAASVSMPNLYTRARLGNYGVIQAVNRADVQAKRTIWIDSYAYSNVAAAVADTDVDATSRVDAAYTIAEVGSNATISAHTVEISAIDNPIYVRARAITIVPLALSTVNHADATAVVDLHPQVHVSPGASITATNNLLIHAGAGSVIVESEADGSTTGGTGTVISTATSNRWVAALVTCDSGSTLGARNLTVESIVPTAGDGGYRRKAVATGSTVVNYIYQVVSYVARSVCHFVASVGCLWGLICDPKKVCDTVMDPVMGWVAEIINSEIETYEKGSQSLIGNIVLNSGIHITGGGTPWATIDSNGYLTGASQVVVRDGGAAGPIVAVGGRINSGTIYIDDIVDVAPSSTLVVRAPSGTTSGSSNVQFDATLQSVTILNLSNRHLVINDIETFNVASPPTITHIARDGFSNWTYTLISNDIECDVSITNNSAANTDITLAGHIMNPSGIVSVHNVGGGGGDILQTGPLSWIAGRIVSLIADSGSIGAPGSRIQVGLSGERTMPAPGGG